MAEAFTFRCQLKDGTAFTLQPMAKNVTMEALQMSIAAESDIMPDYQQIKLNNKIVDLSKINTIGDLNLVNNNVNQVHTLEVEWNFNNNNNNNDVSMNNNSNKENKDNNSNNNNNNNNRNKPSENTNDNNKNSNSNRNNTNNNNNGNNNNNNNNNNNSGDDMSLDSTHEPNLESKRDDNDNDNDNDESGIEQPDENPVTNENTQNNNKNENQQNSKDSNNNKDTNMKESSHDNSNANNNNNNNNNDTAMTKDDGMDDATRALIQSLMSEDANAVDNNAAINAAMGNNSNENKGNDIDFDENMPTFGNFEFDESKIDGTLLSESDTSELFDLLFGKFYQLEDIKRWFQQGIDFVDIYENRLKFGLLQIHGGPCGVIAPLQGYILKEMLFDPKLGVKLDDGSDTPVLATNEQRTEALARACCQIMSKCAIDQTFFRWIVGIKPNLENLYKTKIYYKEYQSVNSLKNAILEPNHIKLLNSNVGVVSFIFSVLLSRTAHVIHDEMDDHTQPLVLEQFGHCSQEIVNLVLTGRAVTNVHDGDKIFGQEESKNNNNSNNNNNNSNNGSNNNDTSDDNNAFVLKGILPNQDIGFLSSLEAMRLAKVGDHYKTPQYPIWVVGSSSHYSILFSLNKNVGKISSNEREKQEIIRLFNLIDQTEQGYITLDKLQDLLNYCKFDKVHTSDAKDILDNDNNGVILRMTFLNCYKYIKALNEFKLRWQCGQCTFHNYLNKNMCNVCNSFKSKGFEYVIEENMINKNNNDNNDKNKNDNNKDKDKDKDKNKDNNEIDNDNDNDEPMLLNRQKTVDIPKNFTLYHYNGLKTTKKDKPTLTKLLVFDDQEIDKIGAIAEEITALIRTKWEYAIVEYDGPFKPKIA